MVYKSLYIDLKKMEKKISEKNFPSWHKINNTVIETKITNLYIRIYIYIYIYNYLIHITKTITHVTNLISILYIKVTH